MGRACRRAGEIDFAATHSLLNGSSFLDLTTRWIKSDCKSIELSSPRMDSATERVVVAGLARKTGDIRDVKVMDFVAGNGGVCSTNRNTAGRHVAHGGTCWLNTHPDEGNVYDFSGQLALVRHEFVPLVLFLYFVCRERERAREREEEEGTCAAGWYCAALIPFPFPSLVLVGLCCCWRRWLPCRLGPAASWQPIVQRQQPPQPHRTPRGGGHHEDIFPRHTRAVALGFRSQHIEYIQEPLPVDRQGRGHD